MSYQQYPVLSHLDLQRWVSQRVGKFNPLCHVRGGGSFIVSRMERLPTDVLPFDMNQVSTISVDSRFTALTVDDSGKQFSMSRRHRVDGRVNRMT